MDTRQIAEYKSRPTTGEVVEYGAGVNDRSEGASSQAARSLANLLAVRSTSGVELPTLGDHVPCIRLLKLHRHAATADDLSCSIRSFELAKCPPFKALSYTWGSPFPAEQTFNTIGEPFPPNEEFRKRKLKWQRERHAIRCNGYPLKIGPNLFEILGQLCSRGEQEYLWIDRLCIDQCNNLERSRQVALMCQIYQKASTVIVCLGPGGTDSSAAAKIQANFASVFDAHESGTLQDKDMQMHDPCSASYLDEFGIKTLPLDVWFAWTQFFRRSWFYRRWTLQETALATNVRLLCGEDELDWYMIKFLVRYLATSKWNAYLKQSMRTLHHPIRALMARNFVDSAYSDLAQWKMECVKSYGAFNSGAILTEFLYRSWQLQCTDPRDFLYGLLGVLDAMGHLNHTPTVKVGFEVDYEAEYADLALAVMKEIVETVPNLAILSLVQDLGRRSNPRLPSWVPDFWHIAGSVVDRRLGLNRRRPASPIYNAAMYSPLVPRLQKVRLGVLHLNACQLGNIAACACDGTSDDNKLAAEFLGSLLSICSGLPTTLRSGHERAEGLWRTLVADSEVTARPAPDDLGLCFRDWVLKYLFMIRSISRHWPEPLDRICDTIIVLIDSGADTDVLPDIRPGSVWRSRLEELQDGKAYASIKKYMGLSMFSRFEESLAIYERVVFRTGGGDVGFGPHSTQPGDQVWLAENARVPFVLRSTKYGSYILLGESYLHGIMDGELRSSASHTYQPVKIV